jgi:hypothetical protein
MVTKIKEVIANWILNHSDNSQEEIVYLLDKAYPEGSQERLVFEWGEIIEQEVSND